MCWLKILAFLSICKIDQSLYLWEIFVLSKAEQTRLSVEVLLFCEYGSKFAEHVQNDSCYSMTIHGIGITMMVLFKIVFDLKNTYICAAVEEKYEFDVEVVRDLTNET